MLVKQYFTFDPKCQRAFGGQLAKCQLLASELTARGDFELLLIGRALPELGQIQVMQHVYPDGYKFTGKGPLLSLDKVLSAVRENPLGMIDA